MTEKFGRPQIIISFKSKSTTAITRSGRGVKIARGCNSLHTFTTEVGQDFRFIKTVETIDLITDDIRDTFRSDYLGKVLNDYDHKMCATCSTLKRRCA